MIRYIPLIFSLILVIGIPSRALAKECPSSLPANLYDIEGADLSLGGELRGVYTYLNEADSTLPEPKRENIHHGAGFLRGMLSWYPSDELTLTIVPEVRVLPDPNCAYDYMDHPVVPLLREAVVEYDAERFRVSAGRQNLVFGSQAVLDAFFDAAEVEARFDPVSIAVFGGVLVPELAREYLSCQFASYYEERGAWKDLCLTAWGDDLAAGGWIALRALKPWSLKALYLYQKTVDGSLDAHIANLFASGPIVDPLSFEIEFINMIKSDTVTYLPGFTAALFVAIDEFDVRGGYAGAFRASAENRFTPVFEAFRLGERQRYGLYGGHTKYVSLKYKPAWSRPVGYLAGYYLHSREVDTRPDSDEIDGGFTIEIGPKYRFWVVYSALNLAGDLAVAHGLRVEVRIIF